MLAMLIGCGLRRAELLGQTMASIQLREEHWVIADLVGKGGHIRTVPIPLWVKKAIDACAEHAHDYAISPAANWIRFSFCSGTFRYKQLNGTLAVNRNCESL